MGLMTREGKRGHLDAGGTHGTSLPPLTGLKGGKEETAGEGGRREDISRTGTATADRSPKNTAKVEGKKTSHSNNVLGWNLLLEFVCCPCVGVDSRGC